MIEFSPQAFQSRNHDQFEIFVEGHGRYTIDVSLPEGYESSSNKYPVILVTDGNLLFDIVQTAVHGRISKSVSLLPEVILIGVGYPDDEGFAGFYARRNYDFHDAWEMTDPLGLMLHQIFDTMKQQEGKPELTMHAGGAVSFTNFLRDELLPGLATHYPIDLKARHTLIGDSSGGHYVLRTLYDSDSPFSRYVCISPGFGSALDSIKEREAAYAASHDDLDVDLFLCCGAVEVDDGAAGGLCRFGSGVTWVAEQMAVRNWPSARVHWEIMNLEDHGSIPARAISAGLRSVFRLRPGVHQDELTKMMQERMAAISEAMAEAGSSAG